MIAVQERPQIEQSRKNLTVCVLDDEPDQVELTRARLDRAGFPVVGTTDSQEALKKVRLGGCRVVIADFKMPGMDGLEFLKKRCNATRGCM